MAAVDEKDVRDGDDPGGRGHRRAPFPGLTPSFTPAPELGQVVVTRFECRNLWVLLAMLVLHSRVKQDVRRKADGLVGARAIALWGSRTMLSVSLWRDIDSVYAMGSVDRHVLAVRKARRRLRVSSTAGVFCYCGDWRKVMFGGEMAPRSPFQPITEGEEDADAN